MALDLSSVEARRIGQGRRTTNRDSIIPDRRLNDAGAFRPQADLRSASRGAAGAEELSRILTGFKRAGTSVTSAITDEFAYDQQQAGVENSARGQMDALAGQKDDALAAKSQAYRKAFAAEDARSQVTGLEQSVAADLDKLLNDPANPADEDDVHKFLEDRFKPLVFGEDGKLRDYGSPEATRVIASGMSELRSRVMAQATKVITEQQHERFLGTLGQNAKAEFAKGQLDFEGALNRRLPGMDLNETRQFLVSTLVEDAVERRDVKGLEALMGSKRPDGQSSFTPDQLRGLRVQREQVEAKIEADRVKAERETWEKNSDVFLDRLNGVGGYPSKGELLKARKAGLISAEFLTTSLNMIDADIAHQDAVADRAEARTQRAWEQQAGRTGDSLVARFVRGEISYGDAQTAILRDDMNGLYGRGDARRKAIGQTRAELTQVNQMRGEALKTPEADAASSNMQLAADTAITYLEGTLKGPALARAKLQVRADLNLGQRQWAAKVIGGGKAEDLGEAVAGNILKNARARNPGAFRKRGARQQ